MNEINSYFSSSIRRKILLGFLAVFVVLGFMLLVSQSYISRITSLAEDVIPLSAEMKSYNELSVSIGLIESNIDKYFTLGYGEYKDGYSEAIRESAALTGKLMAMADEDGKAKLEEISALINSVDSTLSIFRDSEVKAIAPQALNSIQASAYSDMKKAKTINSNLLSEVTEALRMNSQVQKKAIGELIGNFFIISIAIIIVGISVSYVISGSISKPIRKLMKASKEASSGNLDITVDVDSGDEIGSLACAFNSMTRDLKKSRSELENYNKKLEAMVRERTKSLEEANEKLSQEMKSRIEMEKMATLGSLTAGIAHELNNPLVGILNYVQYCQKHADNTEKVISVLKDAEKEVKRCTGIVQNLLTVSRTGIEHEKKLAKENIGDVIGRVSKLLSYKSEKEGVKISVKISDDVPLIQMDSGKMEQVFINLISNAIDSFDVKAKEKSVRIDAVRDEYFVHITVSDNGKGILPENIKKIFEPFFTTKEPGKGTGLGLAISKSIIRDHDGDIRCESTVGEGTKFIIKMPIENEKK